MKELPSDWQRAAFFAQDDRWCLRPELRAAVELRCEDLRMTAPEGPFALVLCRNLAFTYFAEPLQRKVAARLVERLEPGGALLIGAHERLPSDLPLVPDASVRGLSWTRA